LYTDEHKETQMEIADANGGGHEITQNVTKEFLYTDEHKETQMELLKQESSVVIINYLRKSASICGQNKFVRSTNKSVR
jgi:hypothetical protein